jgi:hypothetical protein
VGLGVFVLKVSGEGRRLRMPYGVAYSFDMLLPVTRLRDKHYSGRVRPSRVRPLLLLRPQGHGLAARSVPRHGRRAALTK